MGLTLTPETRLQVHQMVSSGRFRSPEEVVEAVVDRMAVSDSLADWSAEELNSAFDATLRAMLRDWSAPRRASAAA